jgi:ferredoxin/flavodoxin
MLEPKKIDFYYFTGTGNTYLVVNEMKNYFVSNGYEVNLYQMEKVEPQKIKNSTDRIIGLAFPVAFQSTFNFIWEFLKNLPETECRTKIFMVDTLSEYSGGIVGPLKNILKKKGYNPIGAKEIKMPSNLTSKPDKDTYEAKRQKGLKAAKMYAHDLIYETSRWHQVHLPNILQNISQSNRILRFFRKKYPMVLDEEKCTKCELCVKLCPVDNIKMEEYPVWSNNCQFCLRCFSFCPTNAISIKNSNFKPYKSIKADDIL